MAQSDRETILRTLNGAIQSKKLYPPGHPSASVPAKKTFEFLSGYFAKKSKLVVGMVDDALVVENAPVVDAARDYPELITSLKQKNLEAIIFKKGINADELLSLFDLLSDEKPMEAEDVEKELALRAIKHVELKTMPKDQRGFLAVYTDAIGVVKNVMGDIRMGKIPKTDEVNSIANEMSDLVFSDPYAMVGLTMIKNYDNYLYNHSVNVSILSLSIGNHLKLSDDELHMLGVASLLHDVGKTGVSEDIIKKPGGLSSDEWEKVKEHPVLGSEIAKRMEGLSELVGRIIYEHHIKYDHSGYPKTKSDLHKLSMIVCIADAYDALTTLRVYQKPYQPVDAVKIIKDLAGKHFDPETAISFENMIGFYPVGTMVRLNTNEVGVVKGITPDANDRPLVKILYDSAGALLEEPYEVDLMENKELIAVGSVDPLARNIDMGEFFEKETEKDDLARAEAQKLKEEGGE